MAVGKGSMERAAKAVSEKKQTTVRKTTVKVSEKAPVKGEVIGAPSKEVLDEIVYQKSNGMLDRDAEPGENFYLGDAMPVYYF